MVNGGAKLKAPDLCDRIHFLIIAIFITSILRLWIYSPYTILNFSVKPTNTLSK